MSKRGRPPVDSAALLNQQDTRILIDASNMAESHDRDAVVAAIPKVVRELLRLGQLPWLGGTEQEAVDRHSRDSGIDLVSLLSRALAEEPPLNGRSDEQVVQLGLSIVNRKDNQMTDPFAVPIPEAARIQRRRTQHHLFGNLQRQSQDFAKLDAVPSLRWTICGPGSPPQEAA